MDAMSPSEFVPKNSLELETVILNFLITKIGENNQGWALRIFGPHENKEFKGFWHNNIY